ncbi:hypothetical protein IFM89_027340 [Coptis chinensis]|uniref:Uncharacterized protein n=1 Tax=Coptis chinensis TaxID=261450 RepID=A0A835GZC9_9MAGN|nr:hypothetical protein IFM89_027340 [Coptis chinensis]
MRHETTAFWRMGFIRLIYGRMIVNVAFVDVGHARILMKCCSKDFVGKFKVPPKISTYTIGPFQSTKDERAKLKVKVKLNLHGIVAIESATLMEEEVEAPVMKEPMKMGTDETPSEVAPVETGERDVSMEDFKSAGDASGVENGAAESGDKPGQMETDAKVEAPKRKVKKTNVPISELVYGGMAAVDLQKAVEKEFEMALQDRVMEETKDKLQLIVHQEEVWLLRCLSELLATVILMKVYNSPIV